MLNTTLCIERLETLTPREREVLACVVTGMLNKQIADALGMSEKTVKVHRGRIMQKMHAISLVELVRMADKVGVPTSPCHTDLSARRLRALRSRAVTSTAHVSLSTSRLVLD